MKPVKIIFSGIGICLGIYSLYFLFLSILFTTFNRSSLDTKSHFDEDCGLITTFVLVLWFTISQVVTIYKILFSQKKGIREE